MSDDFNVQMVKLINDELDSMFGQGHNHGFVAGGADTDGNSLVYVGLRVPDTQRTEARAVIREVAQRICKQTGGEFAEEAAH